MQPNCLTFEQLKQITGYEKPADIAHCLTRNGVKVLKGKNNRPFTTIDALNDALGIGGKDKTEEIEIF